MWEMTMCTGPDADLVEETFESPEQWRDWLGLHHPRLLKAWHGEGPGWEQYGTDYYWSNIRLGGK